MYRSLRLITLPIAFLGVLAPAAFHLPNAARAHAKSAALFPVTIRDDTGYKTTIPRKPKRIISLDPRDTETLFALDLEKRVVADGGKEVEFAACCKKRFRYPAQWPSPWGRNYPMKAPRLPHIEGGYDAAHPFDIELVEKKRPNLVVSLNSDQQGIDKMRQVGLKVVVLDPHTFAQIEHDIKLIGRITGNIGEARTVLRNIAGRYHRLLKQLSGIHRRPRVFYEIDDSSGTPYTACAGSFIDQMLTQDKAVNVAHNVTPCPAADPYPQMSTEALVKANPQVILLGDSNYGVTPAQVRARSGWQTISAVRHNRIYRFDDDLVSRAGPREIIGMEKVARLIHPKAFKSAH